MAQNIYRGLIFTNHVLDRIKERGMTQEQIWETFSNPDRQDKVKDADRREKKFGDHTITIVFTYNNKNDVVLISAWMDPPLAGSKDARQKEWWNTYKKAGFIQKIWLTFIKQVSGY